MTDCDAVNVNIDRLRLLVKLSEALFLPVIAIVAEALFVQQSPKSALHVVQFFLGLHVTTDGLPGGERLELNRLLGVAKGK